MTSKQKSLVLLRSMVAEVWSAHREKGDEAYNECEEAECAWCENTREALAVLEQPAETSCASEALLRSVRTLCVAARTTGGVAGRDDGLCAALDRVEAMLASCEGT